MQKKLREERYILVEVLEVGFMERVGLELDLEGRLRF